MKALVRRLVLHGLPRPLSLAVRRTYYRHLLARVTEEIEVDARLLRYLVSPGDHVVDIGANIGSYTKLLAELVGPRGRVYSIEPVHETFDILCANVRAFRLATVEPINCAVSDVDGIAAMEIPHWESGGENFYLARVVPDGSPGSCRRVSIPTRTLDSLLAQAPRPVSLVKCDVEGHELHCLRGATEAIRTARPAWLIEVSGDPDDETTPAHEVFRLLHGKGYGGYWFDGTSLLARRPGDRSVNYWFLTPFHLGRLIEQGVGVEWPAGRAYRTPQEEILRS